MGGYIPWILWIIICVFICETQGNNCTKPLKNCLRCDVTGTKCLKCRNIIVFRKRDCVEACPMGYTQQWSTYNDYMGRICVETSFISSLGFTGETFAVLVGSLTELYHYNQGSLAGARESAIPADFQLHGQVNEISDPEATVEVRPATRVHSTGSNSVVREFVRTETKKGDHNGIVLCLGALLGGCIYIRRRRMKALSVIDENSDSTLTVTPLHQQERGEFIREISLLRHEAPVFLSMLNETRRQFREIHKSKVANHKKELASNSYRPVLRDLCIILMLLNKPDEKIINPPQEWRKLLSWGERVLKRYKRQHNITSPIGELVNFLQVPEQRHFATSRGSLFLPYGTLSTISTNTLASTASRKQKNPTGKESPDTHPARRDSYIDANDRLSECNTVLQMDYPNDVNISSLNSYSDADFDAWDESHTILAEWSASRECLFEDDFVRLGFRPQDEITTEL